MDQAQTCQCSRPDLQEMGGYRCCISCGSVAPQQTKVSRKRKAEEAEIVTDDDTRAAPIYFSRTRFSYKPLSQVSAFRLLRLFPGSREDELACEVFHADISDPPDYEAVSYTWGGTSLTQELHTTEGLIQITENCRSALTDLRDIAWERILWVDAICIAQENNEEKNHQIPLMARIFGKASQVLIHLGETTTVKDTEALFKLLRGAQESLPNTNHKPDMARLLSLPWFSRIWILQEVAMARHAKIIIGSTTLDWRHLSIANIHARGLKASNLAGQAPAVLQISRSDRKPLKDLASLITMARSCQSTDPRDRIYALLGLVDERAGINIVPNYTKTTKEVYTDLAAQVLKTYNCLDVLLDTGWREQSDVGANKTWLHLDALIQRIKRVKTSICKSMPVIKRFGLAVNIFYLSALEMERVKNLVDEEIDDFRRRLGSDEIDNMSTESHTFLSLLTDFQKCMDVSDTPATTNNSFDQKDWKGLKDARISLETGLEAVEANCVALKEAVFTEAMKRRQTSLTPEYIFGLMTIEQESMEVVEENLDLPSWVPDYRYRQSYSFARYAPSLFSGKSIAHFHYGSRNHPLPSLEVKAIFVNKVQSTDWMSLQDIRLCDKWVKFRRDSQLDYIAFVRDLEQGLTENRKETTLDGIRRFSQGRRLVLTEESIAIVPTNFQAGDVIALLYGGTVPYMLRPSASKAGTFQLIGECYLHGIKGPQFAPNYEELLGYFKDPVKWGAEESEFGDLKDFVLRDRKESENTSESNLEAGKKHTWSTESKDNAASNGEQDGLPWKTIFLV